MAINQSNQQDDEKAQGMNSALTNAQPQQDQGQQNQGQQQLSTSSAVSPSQGQTPMQTGSQAPAASPSAPKAPASSGTFTNLKTYLNANQGNRIGSAANQRLQNTATGAQKSIGQASTAFGQKLEQGSLKNRENAVSDVTNIAGAARQVNAAPKPAQPAAPAAPASEGKWISQGVSGEMKYVAPNSPAQATGTQETPAPEQAPQYLSEDQRNRFAEVINARYQGPQSLRDAGLYDPAFQRVQTAQDRLNQVQTAGGRESMLRDTFGNRAYSQGQNKLDSVLLNADQGAVQNLLSKREQIGNLQNKLSTAQNEAQNLSNQRTQEISNIQEQARTGFTSAQTAEKEATDARLSQVVDNWDQLPNYYKDLIRNRVSNNEKMIEEQVKGVQGVNSELQEQYNQANSQINSIAAQRAKIEEELRYNQNNINRYIGKGGPDMTYDARQSVARLTPMLEQLKAQEQQVRSQFSPVIDQYNQAQSSYDSQIANIRGQNKNLVNLSSEEAALLGVGAGAGLYNLGEEAIRTAQAEKDRLVSRDEVARQQALSQLAGLDQQSRLNTNVNYGNLDRAGTQTAMDALDVAATQQALREAEQNFRTSAEGTNLTGVGAKKVSRANATGKKTNWYNASVGGNVADMLRQGGYDVSQMNNTGIGNSLLQNKDMLANYLNATNTNKSVDKGIGGQTLEGAVAGAGTGASIGSFGGPVGAGIGAVIGAGIGSAVGGNSLDQLQTQTDILNQLGEMGVPVVGALGDLSQKTRELSGEVFDKTYGKILQGVGLGSVGSGISGAIRGIDTKAMKAYGDAVAKDLALQDLQNKYSSYLQGQGFENRVNVQDNEATRARTEGLRQILANMDKTNF